MKRPAVVRRPARTPPRRMPAAPGTGLAWPDAASTVCIVLLLLAVVLGANFWVGIVHSTFDDTASGVGVPQHDFFQYYAGGHNWNLRRRPLPEPPGR